MTPHTALSQIGGKVGSGYTVDLARITLWPDDRVWGYVVLGVGLLVCSTRSPPRRSSPHPRSACPAMRRAVRRTSTHNTLGTAVPFTQSQWLSSRPPAARTEVQVREPQQCTAAIPTHSSPPIHPVCALCSCASPEETQTLTSNAVARSPVHSSCEVICLRTRRGVFRSSLWTFGYSLQSTQRRLATGCCSTCPPRRVSHELRRSTKNDLEHHRPQHFLVGEPSGYAPEQTRDVASD
jgi:hypothetical protein